MLYKNILSLHNNTFQAVVVTDHAWPCMQQCFMHACIMRTRLVYVESNVEVLLVSQQLGAACIIVNHFLVQQMTAAWSSLHHSHTLSKTTNVTNIACENTPGSPWSNLDRIMGK